MKRCIGILLLVSTVSLSFGILPFKAFLLNFTPVRLLADTMFVAPQYYKDEIDMKKFGDYLPVLGDGKDEPKCYYYWHKNGWYTDRNGIVTVIAFSDTDIRSCDENSEYNRSLEENTVQECYLLTYTKDGHLIDTARISRDGDCYFSRVKNVIAHPLSLIVEQGVVADGHMFLFYDDLKYKVRRLKYSVSSDGSISSVQEGEVWEELLPQKRSTTENTTFDAYLKLFRKWNKTTLDESVFTAMGKWLDYMSVSSFVPDTLDCQCYPRELFWIPCHYIERGEKYVCFLEAVCEYPKELLMDRYVSRLQLTYTNEGKLTDTKIVSSILYDDDSYGVASQIKKFLKDYMYALYVGDDEYASKLFQRFSTSEIRKRATDASPFIRTEDVNENAIATVACERIEGDWYKVQFHCNGQDSLAYMAVKAVTDSLGGAHIADVASYHSDGK